MTLTQITEKGIKDGEIVNADINASAAIALSKIATGALPTGITIASGNIVNGTIVNADIDASAAIAKSKLASLNIVNADVNSSAAIAKEKLEDFVTGNSNNRLLTATGNTNSLIGESSFTYNGNGGLDMEGTGAAFFQIKTPDSTDGGVYFRTGTTNAGAVSYLHNSTLTSGVMNFRSGGTTKMVIKGDGKVGIGVTAPSELLTVGDGDLKFYHSNAANAHRTTFIEFGNSSNRITSEMNYGADNSSNYTAGLKFTTKNFNGSSFQTVDALNIQANGRVGIGTTSPSQKLTVAYSNGSPWSTSSLGVGMKVENTNAVNGVAAGIELRSFQDNGGASIQYIHAVNDGTSSYGSDLVFSTRVAYTGAYRESCRITNAGNLKMPSGHGIDFSAAPNSGGMNSELLDRYEEGTWTPAWVGSSGTGTFGYSHQVGKYTRIGRHVFYTWLIVATSHSGTTGGAIRVGGLPFAVDASESPSGGTVFFIIGFNDSFDNSVVTQLNSSEEIEFYKQVQSSGANYNSVSASSMNLGGLYAKGAGHYIS